MKGLRMSSSWIWNQFQFRLASLPLAPFKFPSSRLQRHLHRAPHASHRQLVAPRLASGITGVGAGDPAARPARRHTSPTTPHPCTYLLAPAALALRVKEAVNRVLMELLTKFFARSDWCISISNPPTILVESSLLYDWVLDFVMRTKLLTIIPMWYPISLSPYLHGT